MAPKKRPEFVGKVVVYIQDGERKETEFLFTGRNKKERKESEERADVKIAKLIKQEDVQFLVSYYLRKGET